ncbi:MAG: hypothetical protein JWQ25_2580, partial [Daejeonella sp.]|nr:hypothetical protein [Daejeonella sp.]
MLFNKRLYAAALLSLSVISSRAQTTNSTFDLKKMLPSSPEAAMLARFGDIPIGLYTGTANVSIPLYTIKEAGLEIPVTLSYHGSGIRVEDQASNVGLGWSFEPGGAIIQIINGKEDFADNMAAIEPTGYSYLLNQGPTSVYFERNAINYSDWVCSSYMGDSPAMFDGMAEGKGQPDVYQYSFAGYSGKFSINPQTGAILLIDKKTDITFIKLDYSSWLAKTLDGNKFYFQVKEYSTSGSSLSEYTGVTFKLSKIELHNGKNITFDYQDGYYQWFVYNESFHSDYPFEQNYNSVVPYNDYTKHYTKTLKTITTDNIIVDFNLEDRQDLYTANTEGKVPAKRIQSVTIKERSGKIIKTYGFTYNYFNSDNLGIGGNYLMNHLSNPQLYSDALSKRLKLLSVQEIGYTSTNQPIANMPYEFTYDETITLPLKTSFACDFWGYYNGQNNSKMIPDLSFFYFSNDPDYQNTLDPNKNIPSKMLFDVQGANRSPDSTKMKAALLKKIKYPTGGYTEFDYQANTFNNHVYPDIERLKAAKKQLLINDYNTSSSTSVGTFSLPTTQNITFYNLITRGPNQSLSFSDLQPSTITLSKIVSGTTTIIKSWQMFTNDKAAFDAAGGNFQWTESITLPYVANALYTLTTSLPDALGPQSGYPNVASVISNFGYFEMPQNYETSYGGGVRVSAIRNYSESGKVTNTKLIKYMNTNGVSSGILMSPLKSLFNREINGLKQIGALDALIGTSNVWFISSESAVPFSSAASGSLVGYSRVEEIELAPDGISSKGKHVYYYNNVASVCHANVPDVPNLQNGMISKEEVFNTSSTVPIAEIVYGYTDLETSYFNGV